MRSFFFTALILLIGRSVYWTEPYGVSVDESVYMSVAEAWDHYDATYSQGVDRKPPLLFGLYFVIGKAFGFFNIHAVHIVFLIWMFILCILAELIVRQLNPKIPKGLTMIFAAIISSSFPREFVAGDAEHASMLPLMLGFLALVRAMKLPSQKLLEFFAFVFFASALAALATAFKQVAALPYAGFCIVMGLWLLKQKRFQSALTLIAGVLLGVGTIYALIVGYFVTHGELEDFLQWNLWDNFTYVQGGGGADNRARPFLWSILAALSAWPIFWWGFAHELRMKFMKPDSIFFAFVGALVGAWGVTVLSPRMFTHYFVPLAFILIIVSANGLWSLLSRASLRLWIWGGLSLWFSVFFIITTFRDETLGRISKPAPFSKATQMQIREIAEHISSNSLPSDRLSIWGMAPQIHVLSKRGAGTRFIPADYPSGRMGGFESGAKHADADRYLEIFIGDLETRKPLYFVDTASAGMNHYEYFQVESYPSLDRYLKEHYSLEKQIHGVNLWRRNPNQ